MFWEGLGDHFGRILEGKIDTKFAGFFEGFCEGFRIDFGSQNAAKIAPKVGLVET